MCGVFNCATLFAFLTCARSFQQTIVMPRIKTESLQEGMVVSADVRNIDNMLLIPSGCTLTARQISILQAWGVAEIEVQNGGAGGGADLMETLPPEVLEKLAVEVRGSFWKADDSDPVFAELFRIILRRRASRPAAQ
jgi:hypothetical protein